MGHWECKYEDDGHCSVLRQLRTHMRTPGVHCKKCDPSSPEGVLDMLARADFMFPPVEANDTFLESLEVHMQAGMVGKRIRPDCNTCGKTKNIIKGFTRYVWERISLGRKDELTIMRAAICNECEHRTFLNLAQWFIGKVQEDDLPINHTAGPGDALWCSKCGCCIEAKIRVPDEQCPLGKWSETETHHE